MNALLKFTPWILAAVIVALPIIGLWGIYASKPDWMDWPK
jgi:hypothetical protein